MPLPRHTPDFKRRVETLRKPLASWDMASGAHPQRAYRGVSLKPPSFVDAVQKEMERLYRPFLTGHQVDVSLECRYEDLRYQVGIRVKRLSTGAVSLKKCFVAEDGGFGGVDFSDVGKVVEMVRLALVSLDEQPEELIRRHTEQPKQAAIEDLATKYLEGPKMFALELKP